MLATVSSPYLAPILLLVGSNIFMTLAWYGHLRFKDTPLWGVVLAQLKTAQEVITLAVFAGFSIVYLKEPLTWNYAVGFAFTAFGAFFIFHKW